MKLEIKKKTIGLSMHTTAVLGKRKIANKHYSKFGQRKEKEKETISS